MARIYGYQPTFFKFPQWLAISVLTVIFGAGFITFYSAHTVAVTEQTRVDAALSSAVDGAALLWQSYFVRANVVASLMASSLVLDEVTGSDDAAEAMRNSLRQIRTLTPEITQVSVINPDGFFYPQDIGKTIGSGSPTEPIRERLDLRDREHYQAIALRGLPSFIGKPVIGRVSRKKTIQYSYPSLNWTNGLLGVVVVSLDLEYIAVEYNRAAQKSHDYVIVARADGYVMYSTAPTIINEKIDMVPFGSVPPGSVTPQMISVISPLDGVRRRMAVRAIVDTDLFVGVGIAEDRAMEAVEENQKHIWIVGIISGGTLTFLIVLIYLMIILKIHHKIEKEKIITKNRNYDYLYKIFYESNDYIHFDSMISNEVFCNRKMLLYHGYPPTWEAGPMDIPKMLESHGMSSIDAADVLTKIESLQNGEQLRQLILPAQVNGQLRQIEFDITKYNISLIEEYSLSSSGYFWCGRDITNRLEGEAELARLRRDLEFVVLTGPGVPYRAIVTDADEFTVQFPAGHGRFGPVFGVPMKNSSDPLGGIIDPSAHTERMKFIDSLRQNGHATARYRSVGTEGDEIWIRDIGIVVSRHETELSVAGYYTDDTRLIDAELAVEQSARLIRLGEVAGGLSHELNQPLAAISMAAENGIMILEDGATGIPDAKIKFERIAGFAVRAATIVRDMRRFASLENAKRDQTSVATAVEAALEILSGKIGETNLDIRVDVDAVIPPVAAMPGLLEQVVVNLVANSIDAHIDNPQPAGTVGWIAIRATDLPNDLILLSVSDNAGGFDPGIAELLFEPFFTTKGPSKGTGLGLSVSYGIIRQCGGTLTAHNADGGAVFDVILPTWKNEEPTPRI